MIGKDLWQVHYQILLIISQKQFKKLNVKIVIVIESIKDNLIKYKRPSCNKNYSNNLDEELKKLFRNIFKFSNYDINKFILLLRKAVYPHEYIDEWEKFPETSLPEKEDFYSNLNMQITCMQKEFVKTLK